MRLEVRLASGVALVALVASVACGPSGEAIEAGRIVHAIDVVRDAPNTPVAPRQRALEALAREPARGDLAVRARDACVRAYRPLLEGNAITERVRSAIAGPARDDAKLARELADAEVLVARSRESMPRCEEAIADLRRRFRR